uniref:Uncharacterized protein n=1 Tax=Plectus sambesii TaxID=2011161 RepID=A0A914XCC2_9BILA
LLDQLTLFNVEQVHDRLLLAKDNLARVLFYGRMLAEKEGEVNDILRLLHCVDSYSKLNVTTRSHLPNTLLSNSSHKLFRMLSRRDKPRNRGDLDRSIRYLADTNLARPEKTPNFVSQRSLLQHGAQKGKCWRFLRYSIESVFEHDELNYLRQAAALVAVRAYKWKAIDFHPDDVERYLNIATAPYLSNPTLIFERRDSLPHHYAFIKLVLAVLSAATSDLPSRNKLSVRLDDAYWDNFMTLLNEKHHQHASFSKISVYLLTNLGTISKLLTSADQQFISFPFGWPGSRRSKMCEKLMQYSHVRLK